MAIAPAPVRLKAATDLVRERHPLTHQACATVITLPSYNVIS